MKLVELDLFNWVALAFFSGSVPYSFLIAKLKGVNLKSSGSGNPGATNLYRCCGKLAGFLGFMADGLKGFLPVFLCLQTVGINEYLPVIVAMSAIFGHVFSPFLKFRGGKGVATSFGAFLALAPFTMISLLFLWIIITLISQIAALGSVGCSIALIPALIIFHESRPGLIYVSGLISLLVIFSHRSNLRRIFKRSENRV